MINIAAPNVIILSTPRQIIGTVLGTATLLKYVGTGIGHVIAGMYMHTHMTSLTLKNGTAQFFPSPESYIAIFLYSALLSFGGIVVAVTLVRRSPKCQHHSIQERGEIGAISKTIIEEVSKWSLITVYNHPFGGVGFKIKRRDAGHVHGDKLVDLPLLSGSRERQDITAMQEAESLRSNIDNPNKDEVSNGNYYDNHNAIRKDTLPFSHIPAYTDIQLRRISYFPRNADDIEIIIKKFRSLYDTTLAGKS